VIEYWGPLLLVQKAANFPFAAASETATSPYQTMAAQNPHQAGLPPPMPIGPIQQVVAPVLANIVGYVLPIDPQTIALYIGGAGFVVVFGYTVLNNRALSKILFSSKCLPRPLGSRKLIVVIDVPLPGRWVGELHKLFAPRFY